MSAWDHLNEALVQVAHLQAQELEQAIEAALQGGTCGVWQDGDGARPDARVPYGEVWCPPLMKWDMTALWRRHWAPPKAD